MHSLLPYSLSLSGTHYQERALGKEHPEVLNSRAMRAKSFAAIGELASAERELRIVIAVQERTLGPAHRETLTSRTNLACYLSTSNMGQPQTDDAFAQVRSIVDALQQALNPGDPVTLYGHANLACSLHLLGRSAEAAPELQSLLPVLQRGLGPQHPYTLGVLTNLVVLNLRRDGAAPMAGLRLALAACQEALGHEHPKTLELHGKVAA
jgi:hypothetical protein